MRRRNMRTYKLRLSPEGFAYFIDCHARIARSLGEMIPYGMTLYVAVSILAASPVAAWIDGDDERISKRLAGEKTYYVGYSYEIVDLIASIARARVAEGRSALPVGQLYLLALRCLALISDSELRTASEQAAVQSSAADQASH